MSTAIEDRVYALLVKELGVKRSKLTPSTTLSRDLGLEGDDAVEFLKNFEKEFSADLKLLRENWNSYFSSESVSPVAYIPCVIATILFAIVFPQSPPWLSVLLGLLLGFAVLLGWIRVFGKNGPLITVQDLIDCATQGKWTKTLMQDSEQKGLAPRIAR